MVKSLITIIMQEKELKIQYLSFDSISELSTEDRELIIKAREVAQNAWAPYSNFHVGAALRLENGTIVSGNNQENAAYPSGLCAERVAMFAANANYPKQRIISMAVTAFNKNGQVPGPVKPCGACRQALLESESRFGESIRIILDGVKELYLLDGIKNLLPLSFDQDALNE